MLLSSTASHPSPWPEPRRNESRCSYGAGFVDFQLGSAPTAQPGLGWFFDRVGRDSSGRVVHFSGGLSAHGYTLAPAGETESDQRELPTRTQLVAMDRSRRPRARFDDDTPGGTESVRIAEGWASPILSGSRAGAKGSSAVGCRSSYSQC